MCQEWDVLVDVLVSVVHTWHLSDNLMGRCQSEMLPLYRPAHSRSEPRDCALHACALWDFSSSLWHAQEWGVLLCVWLCMHSISVTICMGTWCVIIIPSPLSTRTIAGRVVGAISFLKGFCFANYLWLKAESKAAWVCHTLCCTVVEKNKPSQWRPQ